ncbi:hypothetical protein CTEN210_13330 [Chaetoceros tenuissimus]|uniref:MalT-like TPR region domain-containing protein n=1 Tax=Chaetoceros tenuissimus TaxID=426638 RepID=A0AAD3HBB7_9STRA|nr:hypothetical protein CTEN210_13330 [Chaetoceros tenuissimus]
MKILTLLLISLPITSSFIIPFSSIPQKKSLQIHHQSFSSNDESLSTRFSRAVILQRSGEYSQALEEYQTFIKAAESLDIETTTYAEVYINMGSTYMKLSRYEEAKECFLKGIEMREMGSAYLNLALLVLAQGQQTQDRQAGVDALVEAKGYLMNVVRLKDDERSLQAALKLMKDINDMLVKSGVAVDDDSSDNGGDSKEGDAPSFQ